MFIYQYNNGIKIIGNLYIPVNLSRNDHTINVFANIINKHGEVIVLDDIYLRLNKSDKKENKLDDDYVDIPKLVNSLQKLTDEEITALYQKYPYTPVVDASFIDYFK